MSHIKQYGFLARWMWSDIGIAIKRSSLLGSEKKKNTPQISNLPPRDVLKVWSWIILCISFVVYLLCNPAAHYGLRSYFIHQRDRWSLVFWKCARYLKEVHFIIHPVMELKAQRSPSRLPGCHLHTILVTSWSVKRGQFGFSVWWGEHAAGLQT